MMDQNKRTYLTIQKTIKLLKPEHIQFFKQYLATSKASLPLKLVNSIEPGFNDLTGIEELCERVYGRYDLHARRNFNQLASHTFQLTGFISRNFPNYLSHNLTLLDTLLAKGLYEEAIFMCECLLDIAERIGDNMVRISCLKFLAQQAFLQNSKSEALRIHEAIKVVLNEEHLINDLYIYFRLHFDIGRKDDSILDQLNIHLNYFSIYHNHQSGPVRLLSKYASNFIHYYFSADGERSTLKLENFYEELQHQGIIVFPLLEDLMSKTGFLILNNSAVNIHSGQGRDQFNKFKKHTAQIFFWKNYNHLPELFTIAIQSTYFVSRYHPQIHKVEFRKSLPEKAKKDIQNIIDQSEKLLLNKTLKTNFVNDYIKLRVTYGALLMLGGKDKIKKALSDLEELMITFQQSSFSASFDSIFICIMVGYFALGDYKRCTETFNRYIKLAKGRVIISENNIDIHTYYYLAQWLFTGRHQYLRKLEENYATASLHINRSIINSMEILANDFSLDVNFLKD